MDATVTRNAGELDDVLDVFADDERDEQLSEVQILNLLRERYVNWKTHCTWVGRILISVNPYEWGKHGRDEICLYGRTKQKNQARPHVHFIAEQAFRNVRDKSSQAIIISGESGAGKTEATKMCLRYLVKAATSSRNAKKLTEMICNANPLLEAFGNAKTIRNDNSSRFGKFISIWFENGAIVGGEIKNYLLEKTRIVMQSENERNYHIFYQLVKARDSYPELGLDHEQSFNYLKGKVWSSDNLDLTKACLHAIRFDEHEQKQIFRTLAAILHLGNLTFNEHLTVASEHASHAFTTASNLLDIQRERMVNATCYSVVRIGKDEVITKPLDPQSAHAKRDALAKMIYSLVFRKIVLALNESLSPGSHDIGELAFIGLLDIYGFEVFEINSFEQFCINFANERLQRHFNRYVFELEQEIYESEGIDWSVVSFNDNKSCIDLFDASPLGILDLLDEECLMPQGTDATLLQKMHTQHHHKTPKSLDYHFPRFNNTEAFGIRHYAGVVTYHIDGFLRKNTENLSSDSLRQVLMSSTNPWVQSLFNASANIDLSKRRSFSSSLRASTVSHQFRKQLQTLIQQLESCEPHFIRCIKPNENKKPWTFDTAKVAHQLNCAGMYQVVEIRRHGFSWRMSFERFVSKFGRLAIQRVQAGNNARETCRKLMEHLSNDVLVMESAKAKWQVGKSRVFLKSDLYQHLESLCHIRKSIAGWRIQIWFRHWHQEKEKHRMELSSTQTDLNFEEEEEEGKSQDSCDEIQIQDPRREETSAAIVNVAQITQRIQRMCRILESRVSKEIPELESQSLENHLMRLENIVHAAVFPSRNYEDKQVGVDLHPQQELKDDNEYKVMLRENIALADELLETRASYRSLLVRYHDANARAAQAESTNETLCELIRRTKF